MKGNLSISRFTGKDSGISIELQDDISRVQVVRIELTPEQWGNAISGLSCQECDFKVGTRIDRIGMKFEYKTELVPIKGYSFTKAEKLGAVAAFEKDGWKADLGDIGNHHKAVRGVGYHVGFRRHVTVNT